MYAQTQPKNAIAEPTKIQFTKNPSLSIVGEPKESGEKEFFENKEVEISAWQYSHSVVFTQLVKLKFNVKTNVAGTITYQACTEERCRPPKTISFTVPINK